MRFSGVYQGESGYPPIRRMGEDKVARQSENVSLLIFRMNRYPRTGLKPIGRHSPVELSFERSSQGTPSSATFRLAPWVAQVTPRSRRKRAGNQRYGVVDSLFTAEVAKNSTQTGTRGASSFHRRLFSNLLLVPVLSAIAVLVLVSAAAAGDIHPSGFDKSCTLCLFSKAPLEQANSSVFAPPHYFVMGGVAVATVRHPGEFPVLLFSCRAPALFSLLFA